MTNAEYDRQEILRARRRLAEYDAGTLAEKSECMQKFLEVCINEPQKLEGFTFDLLEGVQGHGERELARKFSGNNSPRNVLELFSLVAQFEFMTGKALSEVAWTRLTAEQREKVANATSRGKEKHNRKFLDLE